MYVHMYIQTKSNYIHNYRNRCVCIFCTNKIGFHRVRLGHVRTYLHEYIYRQITAVHVDRYSSIFKNRG